MSGLGRALAGVAGWAAAGILLNVVWLRTVGGVPPAWAALLLGAVVFGVVAFGRGRAFGFWRDQTKGQR